jgi:hypothetical protein
MTKGESVVNKTHIASLATSSTPLCGNLTVPTLCTCHESEIPRPPAAEAATRGREISDTLASEVELPGGFKKSLSFTIAGKEDGQAPPSV